MIHNADPSNSDAFRSRGQPEVLNGATGAVQVCLSHRGTAQDMSAPTLTGTSDTEIDRRFLNPFELEAPVEDRLGACITHRCLLIRLEEQLFYSPLRRALSDYYKIPWLHEPDRPGVMRRGQNSRKHIVRDRLPQKIATDIPPLKNHAVDCIPFMVGELSAACTPDILTYSHIS
jgi:hypothetical protein